MPKHRDTVCPVRKLNWEELDELLRPIDPALSDAFLAVKKSLGGHREAPPFYSVKYAYGSVIIGPEESTGSSRLLLKPCSNATTCPDCTELLDLCGEQLPLGIVLTRSAEVYLEFESSGQSAPFPPFVPLRILRPGDTFGVFELLDEIACSTKANRPRAQWKVSSGTRSLYISAPLGNEAIPRKVLKLLKDQNVGYKIWSKQPSHLKAKFDEDAWEFIKAVAAIGAADGGMKSGVEGWNCEILLIPVRWLHTIRASTSTMSAASRLFLHLYGVGWEQSLHLRQYPADLPQVSGILAAFPRKGQVQVWKDLQQGYIHRTLLHIEAIARGDLPGFTPVSSHNEGGPFTELIQYMKKSGLYDLVGLRDHFPYLLQAYQGLKGTVAPSNILYYSLHRPALLGPISHEEDKRATMITIHRGLNFLRDRKYPLGGLQGWKQLTSNEKWTEEL